MMIITGFNWGFYPVKIKIDDDEVKIIRIAQGLAVSRDSGGGSLMPDASGSFVVMVSTLGIKPGKHEVKSTTVADIQIDNTTIKRSFEVTERQQFAEDGTVLEKPYWRALDFFNRRFGHIGFVPPGVKETQIGQIRMLEAKAQKQLKQQDNPAATTTTKQHDEENNIILEKETVKPNSSVCNWNPVGAGPVPKAQTRGYPKQPISGRTLAIAIDPNTSSTVYIGTAGGGIWKSTDNGATWSPKTDHNMSLAIGAMAIDPNNSLRILAGTGEYSSSSGSTSLYYGNGLLKSEDGGNTWIEIGTAFFQRVEITRILFDPYNSLHILLSSSVGVFESLDGGNNWGRWGASVLGDVTDLVMIIDAGPPVTIKLIAGVYFSGLWTSTKTGSVCQTGLR